MKPVFRCDYCNFIGTEEEVKKHEVECTGNYDRKSCFTCKHKSFKNMNQYKCDCGKEIPENKIFEFCPKYDRKELSKNDPYSYAEVFGSIFGL